MCSNILQTFLAENPNQKNNYKNCYRTYFNLIFIRYFIRFIINPLKTNPKVKQDKPNTIILELIDAFENDNHKVNPVKNADITVTIIPAIFIENAKETFFFSSFICFIKSRKPLGKS